MMIWLTAVILLALRAFVGYYQGAVRVAFSLVGLVIAAFAAFPLSPLVKPILNFGGVHHPFWKAVLAPVVVFVVIMILVKMAAHAVHQKLEYKYQYKATHGGQLQWERFNSRVGACLGLFNGFIYFLLLMLPIYGFGYAATQIISGGNDPAALRLLAQARQQLRATKFDRVVAGADPAPQSFYDAADIVGLIYKNPLLESRLTRYPSFLTLAEQPEFQALLNDVEFHELWQSGARVGDILKHPNVQAIVDNPAASEKIQQTLAPDLKDLKEFLVTGKSAKYDGEKILGRWNINITASINMERRNRNLSPAVAKQLRARMAPYIGATLIATPDNQAILKRGEAAPSQEGQPKVMATGNWSRDGGSYKLTLEEKSLEVTFESSTRLILPKDGLMLVFDKEV